MKCSPCMALNPEVHRLAGQGTLDWPLAVNYTCATP
jgi:hypothetical protein